MKPQPAEAGIDAIEQRQENPGPRPIKSATGRNRGRLAHLEAREAALRDELEKARVEEGRCIESLESHQQALADGEGTAADVARARRAVEEIRATVADLEVALAGISEKRKALAAELASEERDRERQRQERAALSSRDEADQLVEAFIAGLTTLTAPLVERKALAERFSHQFPLAAGIPDLKLDALARGLQAALNLPNDGDGTRVATGLVLRALARPLDPAPPVRVGTDRLAELGISE